MTPENFQSRVTEALEAHRPALVFVLRQLVNHEYPPEVVAVAFEIFPDDFTSGFPARAFFMDKTNSEFFLFEHGKAVYPSPVDPGLLTIPRVYESALEDALEEADPEADSYTLAGMAMIGWFAARWVEAGGKNFARKATIALHDDLAAYDLVNQEWLDE